MAGFNLQHNDTLSLKHAKAHSEQSNPLYTDHDHSHVDTPSSSRTRGKDPNSSNEGVFVEEEKHTATSGVTYWMGWWVEVLGLMVSAALFVVIVVVLREYNGKLQPKWAYDFNLNALVALLTTFLRITMMDVVTKSKC